VCVVEETAPTETSGRGRRVIVVVVVDLLLLGVVVEGRYGRHDGDLGQRWKLRVTPGHRGHYLFAVLAAADGEQLRGRGGRQRGR
jgi:hypothetical protein